MISSHARDKFKLMYQSGGGFNDCASFDDLIDIVNAQVSFEFDFSGDNFDFFRHVADACSAATIGDAELHGKLSTVFASLDIYPHLWPFCYFNASECISANDSAQSDWRAVLICLAAVAQPQNPWIAGAASQALAQAGRPEAAERWRVRTLDALFADLNASVHKNPSQAWQSARTIEAEFGSEPLSGDVLRKREAVRLALLKRLSELHIPNYYKLVERLSADGDRYGVHAGAWGHLGHPAIPNLISGYLGMPIPELKIDQVPGAKTDTVFPSGVQDMPAAGFFGPPFEYPDPPPVPYGAGLVHRLPRARVYIDTWKTGIWSERHGFLDELSHGPGALAFAAERLNYLRPDSHDLRLLQGRTAVVSKRSAWEWYAHWITEVLPMVGMIWQAGHDFDQLIAFNSGSNYCKEGFEALGISPDRIVDGKEYIYASVEDAIIPRAAITMSGETPLSDFSRAFVKDLFLKTPSASRGRRIYVSRRMARARRLINEEEIATLLAAHGFETVDLENLSMRDKASLMNECEAVAGVYGAGLGNLLFCEPGTKVLEIRPHRSNWWIQHLSAGLKLCYVCVAADVPDQPEYDQYTDIHVGADFVAAGLKRLEL